MTLHLGVSGVSSMHLDGEVENLLLEHGKF